MNTPLPEHGFCGVIGRNGLRRRAPPFNDAVFELSSRFYETRCQEITWFVIQPCSLTLYVRRRNIYGLPAFTKVFELQHYRHMLCDKTAPPSLYVAHTYGLRFLFYRSESVVARDAPASCRAMGRSCLEHTVVRTMDFLNIFPSPHFFRLRLSSVSSVPVRFTCGVVRP